MDVNSQRPKGRGGALSSLNVTIEALNLAKEISGIAPAKAVFGSVSVLLTMIRVCPLFYNDELRVHMYPGFYGQQSRLYRTWTSLRRCM